MVLILFFIVAFIAFLILYFQDIDMYGFGAWTTGIILACCLLAIPISHYNFKLRIAEFESRKETVYQQREMADTEYERAMLTQEIINNNAWLTIRQASKKMIWFNWYTPKEILEIEPIK